MINMDDIAQLAQEQSEIIIDDLMSLYYNETDEQLIDESYQMQQIQILIDKIILDMEQYENETKLMQKTGNLTIDTEQSLQKLQLKKDLIYADFFKLQNLINAFIGQKIIMTYVHVDENGEREIRIFDNDIAHLSDPKVISNYGRSYAKLGYEVENNYLKLKNSLPKDQNNGLQYTAKEVEDRYVKYRGRILWQINMDEWVGYRLYNRGPINEAFVAFYIREIQLNNSIDDNINTFMTAPGLGVIYADNANGFLIGDVSLGDLQFAVKGAFGSPQNFATIIKWLKEIKNNNFSQESFNNFIARFKDYEKEKATPLVKPLTERSLAAMLKYHRDELISSLKI